MDMEKEEYELQLLGFSVEQLKCEHENMVRRTIELVAKNLVESCIRKLDLPDEKAILLRDNVPLVMEATMEQSGVIPKMNTLFEQHFTIPDNVLLPEDQSNHVDCTELEESEAETKLQQLQNIFVQNNCFKTGLQEELSKYNQIDEMLAKETEMHVALDEAIQTPLQIDEMDMICENIRKAL